LQNVQRETSTFVIKALLVAAFSLQAPELLDLWRGYIIDGSLSLGDLVSDDLNSAVGCPEYGNTVSVFDKFDCIALKMFGVPVSDGESNFMGWASATISLAKINPLAFIIIAFAIFLFFIFGVGKDGMIDITSTDSVVAWIVMIIGVVVSGSAGVLLVIIVLLSIFALIMSMVKAVFIYIVSIIALTFLIGITPMILPLIMFNNKALQEIPKEWLNHIMVYSLQPVILTAFLVLTFNVADDLVAELGKFYQEVDKIVHDPTKQNRISTIGFPETQVDTDVLMSREQDRFEAGEITEDQMVVTNSFKELEESGSPIPQSNESSYTFLPASGGLMETVMRDTKDKVADLISGQGAIPGIEMEQDKVLQFIALNIAVLILFWVMVSFLHAMPDMIADRLVGKGVVAKITKYGTGASGEITDRFIKASNVARRPVKNVARSPITNTRLVARRVRETARNIGRRAPTRIRRAFGGRKT